MGAEHSSAADDTTAAIDNIRRVSMLKFCGNLLSALQSHTDNVVVQYMVVRNCRFEKLRLIH